ncbi:MAG: hypothetical protein GSR86_02520 [Desulfurococcales archaeon]|nr:hypothetical protein [Desulfurococcales archaeon]
MTEASVTGPTGVSHIGVAGPGEDLERLDLFYSLLGISVVVRGSVRAETLAYASIIYEELLNNLKDKIPEGSSTLINPPLVDALELADCIGAEELRSILEWAVYTLYGALEPIDIELLEAYAECLGWDRGPIGVDDRILAGSVILSFTGSFNKYLARQH